MYNVLSCENTDNIKKFDVKFKETFRGKSIRGAFPLNYQATLCCFSTGVTPETASEWHHNARWGILY